MIEALFVEGESGELEGFCVRGHAGYAPPGRDIVCAGVSALVQTAVAALKRFLSRQPAVIRDSQEEEGACVRLLLPPDLPEEDKKTAGIILQTLEIGMHGIAGSYGKYIEVRRCRHDSGGF
ncbi:ribosomal-processing cysteine protease Prp [Thermacetogenium phaeum]|uniref:ribosomal-processing cysteine protease Prp n=1 Tax=Thermacetogenium phaeum TaxID=85874 RepID=UPI00048E7969|nr:ribosomal-processing cysteine protease Prp [Thermacetogenium phaeum]